jgi:hypothetical protein
LCNGPLGRAGLQQLLIIYAILYAPMKDDAGLSVYPRKECNMGDKSPKNTQKQKKQQSAKKAATAKK